MSRIPAEVCQGLGVGLIERVLGRRRFPLSQPASVDVLIDQRHFGRVPRQVEPAESAIVTLKPSGVGNCADRVTVALML